MILAITITITIAIIAAMLIQLSAAAWELRK